MKCKLTRKLTEDELIVALALGARDTKDFVFWDPGLAEGHILPRFFDNTDVDWKNCGYEAWLFEEVQEDG